MLNILLGLREQLVSILDKIDTKVWFLFSIRSTKTMIACLFKSFRDKRTELIIGKQSINMYVCAGNVCKIHQLEPDKSGAKYEIQVVFPNECSVLFFNVYPWYSPQ
jgi:hypothetical protein